MGLLADILFRISKSNSKDASIKSNFIFYKIVDSINDNKFTLQCINTSALFYANISDIVFDSYILQGLHPVQSCFIGIEYAKYIKKYETNLKNSRINNQKMNQYSLNRYGYYSLCYQHRNGELCFVNNYTNEQFAMDPRDIALTEELITEFDATQAFYIGLLAGLKINNPTKHADKCLNREQSYLYLVK